MKKGLMTGLLLFCGVFSAFAQQYWKGAGGRGMSVAVLVPEGRGLSAEQNYLPTLVQGVFVSDFARYSAISVLDRQALENTLRETESGIYEAGADFVELGKITKTGYILSGSVTRTTSGYSFAVTVADTKTGQAKAAYSGACSVQEFDDFSGIKKASLELLTQMGVNLTDTAKAELSGAGQTGYVQAETALARGIVAERNGNRVESLAYYYRANNYDPKLREAAARVNTLSATVRAGNTGQNVRDEIQRYKNDMAWKQQWQNLIAEAQNYVSANAANDILVEFYYSADLKQGKIDYQRETVDLHSDAGFAVLTRPASLRVWDDVLAGLKATGRQKDWKIDTKWDYEPLFVAGSYSAAAGLYNDRGERLAGATVTSAKTYLRGRTIKMSDSRQQVSPARFTFTVDAEKISGTLNIKIENISNGIPVMTRAQFTARHGLGISLITVEDLTTERQIRGPLGGYKGAMEAGSSFTGESVFATNWEQMVYKKNMLGFMDAVAFNLILSFDGSRSADNTGIFLVPEVKVGIKNLLIGAGIGYGWYPTTIMSTRYSYGSAVPYKESVLTGAAAYTVGVQWNFVDTSKKDNFNTKHEDVPICWRFTTRAVFISGFNSPIFFIGLGF